VLNVHAGWGLGQYGDITRSLREEAKDAAPESPQEGVQQAQTLVKQNPKPAAIAGAVLVLFVLWRLLRR